MKGNFDFITDTEHNKIKLILKALLVGIITGCIVIVYRALLVYAEKGSFKLFSYVKDKPFLIPLLFIMLALIGYIVGKIVEKEPDCGGSGIPQVKAIMGGYIKNRPISIIINKIIGGSLSILSGLSLGREGPSVQLGACTGDYISKKFKSSRLERRLLISSGASAGLSAAFNAPLAGVVFSLEEIYKYFSPLVLLSTIVAAVSADFLSKQVFGLSPVFHFANCPPIPLMNYWLLVILGIICGIAGSFYNKSIEITQKIYDKIKLSTPLKMIPPFLLSGVLGLIFPVVLCGGHSTLDYFNLKTTIGLLLLIVIAKFLFSMISFGSGAPGGIFFPLLIIGAGIGAIFGYIAINFLGISSEYFYNFIILAMAGYFSAIVRAPITGIILISEMTGSLSNLLSLSVVSIISYIIADLLKTEPIYDYLLDRLLKRNNINDYHSTSKQKVIITNMVHFESYIENKKISEITFPENVLVISINRGEDTIVPKGNTIIKAGDLIYVMTDLKNEWKTREYLEKIVT